MIIRFYFELVPIIEMLFYRLKILLRFTKSFGSLFDVSVRRSTSIINISAAKMHFYRGLKIDFKIGIDRLF